MRHINIPIFIPHLGCPNMCVFCNQRTISGVLEFKAECVKYLIEESLSTVSFDDEVEIAFFGGSFTGIDRELMINLLSIANEYIKQGRVSSVRCSTRPDYISEEILEILKSYGVKTVELGLQSTDDDVLVLSKRGHMFSDEVIACKRIVDNGFDLVGQMMIGLPGSTLDKEIKTAEFIIASGAVGARIYPTVVFHDTELKKMSQDLKYEPLTLEEAVNRSASVFAKFTEAGIPVIRIGLCASENLSSDTTYYAGPNHPALGELTVNKYYYDKIVSEATELSLSENDILKVYVSVGSLSRAIGQKKINKIKLKQALNVKEVKVFESSDIQGYTIKLEKETEVRKCI